MSWYSVVRGCYIAQCDFSYCDQMVWVCRTAGGLGVEQLRDNLNVVHSLAVARNRPAIVSRAHARRVCKVYITIIIIKSWKWCVWLMFYAPDNVEQKKVKQQNYRLVAW